VVSDPGRTGSSDCAAIATAVRGRLAEVHQAAVAAVTDRGDDSAAVETEKEREQAVLYQLDWEQAHAILHAPAAALYGPRPCNLTRVSSPPCFDRIPLLRKKA
jgi:hypothetical protein